ncbi:hypothetical protein IPJ72_02505 [Candidatus Peregrinibacteria bacterium]|nr:MAG: hypothetical protein IPJ72_02505 [Candidatus Peregrinibacteria bacterium]
MKKLIKSMLSFFIKNILFIIAAILAIFWYLNQKEYEPIITTILIVAGIAGIYIEKWSNSKQKRKDLLHALVHELYINLNIIQDNKFNPNHEKIKQFVVFPRVINIATEACIVSSAFISDNDKTLFKLMHSWVEHSMELNNRLSLTENAMLNDATPSNITNWREKLRDGETLLGIKESLNDLTIHVIKNYKNESGIDEDTVLFD